MIKNKSWHSISSKAAAALFVCAVSTTAMAQGNQEGDWIIGVHAGRASIDTVTPGTMWNAINDDSDTVVGASISYFLHPNIRIRGTYERGTGFNTTNGCPDGRACPTVAINESGNLHHAAIAILPEYSLTENFDIFGSIGVSSTRKNAGPTLSNYSETGMIVGGGFRYRLDERVAFTTEYQRTFTDYDVLRVGFDIFF